MTAPSHIPATKELLHKLWKAQLIHTRDLLTTTIEDGFGDSDYDDIDAALGLSQVMTFLEYETGTVDDHDSIRNPEPMIMFDNLLNKPYGIPITPPDKPSSPLDTPLADYASVAPMFHTLNPISLYDPEDQA